MSLLLFTRTKAFQFLCNQSSNLSRKRDNLSMLQGRTAGDLRLFLRRHPGLP